MNKAGWMLALILAATFCASAQDAAKKDTPPKPAASASQAVLDAAAQAATSQQELSRVQAATAASLEQTYNLIHAATSASAASTAGILGTDTSAADGRAWWNSYAPANDNASNEALQDEVKALRADLRTALAAIRSDTKKTATILNDVSNGEQTINTVAA